MLDAYQADTSPIVNHLSERFIEFGKTRVGRSGNGDEGGVLERERGWGERRERDSWI